MLGDFAIRISGLTEGVLKGINHLIFGGGFLFWLWASLVLVHVDPDT